MKSKTEPRDALVSALLQCLRQAEPESSAVLRGSLGEGRGDLYRDIDLRWEVSNAYFGSIGQTVPRVLGTIRSIESVRSDPDFQRSSVRRLFFVPFAAVPLFWRVDLEVSASSTQRVSDYAVHNPAARGTDWSWPHSALMNVVGAIKACLRGEEEKAIQVLDRGFHRVGVSVPQVPLPDQMICLVNAVREVDSTLGALADSVEQLHRQYERLPKSSTSKVGGQQ